MDTDLSYFVMQGGENVLIRQRVAGKIKKTFEDYRADRTRSGG